MSYAFTIQKIPNCMTSFWHASCMTSLMGHRTQLVYINIEVVNYIVAYLRVILFSLTNLSFRVEIKKFYYFGMTVYEMWLKRYRTIAFTSLFRHISHHVHFE